jgi:hypothetical protein
MQAAARHLPLLFTLVLAGNLAGCASSDAAHERELLEVFARLPGDYDNLAQVRADQAAAVTPAHAALRLKIAALSAPMVSEYVVFVRETAADDARRIVAQSIWTFSLAKDQVVQGNYQFTEPERWRSGDPAVFRALLPRDLRLLPGCELRWNKSGSDFNATGSAGSCRNLQAADSGEFIVEQLQLRGDELATARQRFAASGEKLDAGADPWYRFRKSR